MAPDKRTARAWVLLLVCLTAAAPHHRRPRRQALPPADNAAELSRTESAQAAQLVVQQKAARAQAAAAARAAVLAQQRTAAAVRLQEVETKVDDAGAKLRAATVAARAAEAEIARRTRDLSALLPLALRLSLYPSETMLAAPTPPDRAPDRALEGLLLARGLSAEMARQVEDLRRRQAEAASLRDMVARQQAVLGDERARQRDEAGALDAQEEAARQAAKAAQDDAAVAAQSAAALAARAESLRGAINTMAAVQLEAQARAVQAAAEAARQRRDTEAARARVSALSRPAGPGLGGAAKISLVAGQIVQAWGAAAEDGPATGITFSTAPAAFVASPCTGRVGFSAPFRSYGRLMIIECGGGYDFVLAGLDRLDAPVGSQIRAGEPVGRMPDYDPASQAEKPALYVELRRAGQPVDPMPFLQGKG